jgi:hypothetical protein
MEEKYIRFYMSFYRAFQGKKSNSLFKTTQSLLNKKIFLAGQKNKNFLKAG